MRLTITIYTLILITQTLFGQNNCVYRQDDCEVINGEIVNCGAPSNKNGNWIHYKTGVIWHSDFFEDTVGYSEGKIYLFLISKGKYFNNSKIGKWTYFSDYKIDEKYFIERIVFYDNTSKKKSLESEFYCESKLESKKFWNHGNIDSVLVYRLNGKLKFRGIYSQNRLQKFWIYYPQGNLKYFSEEIKDNFVKKVIFFDPKLNERILLERDITDIATSENLMKYID